MSKKHRINWHSAAFEVLQIELEEYLQYLQFYKEYHLGKSKDSLRVDTLIIKKISSCKIYKNIGKLFQIHNIIEYKGPGDTLSIDDYYKSIAYCCLYKCNVGNKIETSDVTLTFILPHFPNKLEKHLSKRNIILEKMNNGIYYIHKEIFAIQLIITRELNEKENLWLRCLSSHIEEEKLFRCLEKDYVRHQNEPRYAVPMNAIIWSNMANRKGGKNIMCEALYDLFAEQLAERERKGISQGI
ncbi:MAG: 3-isopropylmalate dehydrogenase, partial [Lachnospiraceae bacterium]